LRNNLIIVLGFLVICVIACDSWKDNPLDEIHTITVTNKTGCHLTIVLDDGVREFDLPESDDSDIFNDVSEGVHLLTAYHIEGLGIKTEIEEIEILVSERKDYFWTINICDPS